MTEHTDETRTYERVLHNPASQFCGRRVDGEPYADGERCPICEASPVRKIGEVRDPLTEQTADVDLLTLPDHCLLVLRLPEDTSPVGEQVFAERLSEWAVGLGSVVAGVIMLTEEQSIGVVPPEQLRKIGLRPLDDPGGSAKPLLGYATTQALIAEVGARLGESSRPEVLGLLTPLGDVSEGLQKYAPRLLTYRTVDGPIAALPGV